MAQSSQPWGGTSTGDASVAPYSDQEWTEMYKYLFSSGKADEGPLHGSGTTPDVGLTVQATGPASASVDVTIGAAVVNGTFYINTATVNLSVAANASGNARIDTVILRKDIAAQTVRLALLQGTPAGTPVPLSLTQTPGVMWEIPLADIAVANGFTTIAAGDITPRRHFAGLSDGTYLYGVLNNSGGTLVTGDVVVWDSTADRAIKTSTTPGDGDVAGVWVGRTSAGGYGRVLRDGIGFVRTNAAVASRNLLLYQSSTAKQAATGQVGTSLGRSLAITSGAGLCLALVQIDQGTQVSQVQQSFLPSGTNTTSTTYVEADANAKVTITPRGTKVKVTMFFHGSAPSGSIAIFDIYSTSLAAYGGDATFGLGIVYDTLWYQLTICHIFSGLTPGVAQEFKLRFKSSAGNSVQFAGYPFTAIAEEVL